MTYNTDDSILNYLRSTAEWLIEFTSKDEAPNVSEENESLFSFNSNLRNESHVNDDFLHCRLAQEEYEDRRSRLKFLDGNLFGEPAWDILLDLYINKVIGRRVSITGACIGAYVPASTALRWITVLEECNLIVREQDDVDARRWWLTLTTEGYQKMGQYFKQRGRRRSSKRIYDISAIERRS